MLLSHNQLTALVEESVIEPVSHDQINSASIDLTLGRKIMVEKCPSCRMDRAIIDFRRRDKLAMEERILDEEEGYVLAPGEFILAQTEEVFHLPNTISGEYKLKSSMARIGLEHLNAGWADAGWHGSVLTLELKNLTLFHHIRIRPGDRIGQMVFFRHEPVPDGRDYGSRGRYNGDTSVSGIKP